MNPFDGDHREVEHGIAVTYWKGNRACGSRDPWTRIEVCPIGAHMPILITVDSDDAGVRHAARYELSRILGFAAAAYRVGGDDARRQIRDALGIRP